MLVPNFLELGVKRTNFQTGSPNFKIKRAFRYDPVQNSGSCRNLELKRPARTNIDQNLELGGTLVLVGYQGMVDRGSFITGITAVSLGFTYCSRV